jgi:hypothetical protein
VAAPIDLSALSPALVDVAPNTGVKSSTAMIWWSATNMRAACLFWLAAFLCSFAA